MVNLILLDEKGNFPPLKTEEKKRKTMDEIIKESLPMPAFTTNSDRLTRQEVFESITKSSEFGKNVYSGKLREEYIGKLNEKQIADICDDYNNNFGFSVKLYQDGTFTCDIYID